MENTEIKKERPRMAIVDPNTLAVLGLKQILQNVMPIMTVETFSTFQDFEDAHPESFYHYFVAQVIVLENRQFFSQCIHKTIVLTITKDPNAQLSGFHSFCINVPEDELVRAILKIEQYGHSGGRNLPELPQVLKNKILSNREIEVLSLIVQGMINKEIADHLCISTNTVITHRRNIARKLQIHSPAGLTIYAIVNNLVDISSVKL